MRYFQLILFIIITFKTAQSQETIKNNLPYPQDQYQEVVPSRDKALQKKLIDLVDENKYWRNLVKSKRMAIGLVDLRQSTQIRYASINGNHMMYAASLPKIAVLLTAMVSIEEGCLNYDKKLKNDLRLMIAKSNNAATTRVIEMVGMDKIASVMTDPLYNLYNLNTGGGLWVGKKYAKQDKKLPDPLKGLSHAATVDQVCRFYTMLAYGKLVNPYYNNEMMKYLVDPEINHKFVKALNKRAPKSKVYRKSGSWRRYHADSALIFGPDGRKYILVALIEDSKGGSICTELVKTAEIALGIESSTPKNIKPLKQKVLKPKRGE